MRHGTVVARSVAALAAAGLIMAGLVGCSTATKAQSCSDMSGQLNKSASKLEQSANDPQAFVTNAHTLSNQMRDKAKGSWSSDVKTTLNAFADDLDTFANELQAVNSGSTTDTTKLQQSQQKLTADSNKLERLCK